jgi:hypothetical protein
MRCFVGRHMAALPEGMEDLSAPAEVATPLVDKDGDAVMGEVNSGAGVVCEGEEVCIGVP